MKNSLLLFGVLLAFGATAQSTRLPARKVTVAPTRPASSGSSTSSGTNRTAARAETRPSSAKLPEGRTVQAAPQPPVSTASTPPPRAGSARPARRSSYGGGLAYTKGDNLLQVGVGLSSYYYGNPFGITYEAGVDRDISVGGQIDYNSSTYGYSGYYGSSRWGYTATYFGLRASYHANRILDLRSDKFDLYAGLGLGYVSFKWRDDYYSGDADYGSRVFLNYFIGGKYYFSKKIGAFAEFGYTGLSSTRIGLAAKF